MAVQQLMAQAAHVTVVKVVAVSNTGTVAAGGTVDVQPLVNQIDGQGTATPHGTIYGIPYCRIQGGVNAIILDPAVGDLGFAVFADRDISSVKATLAQANPGSRRQFDWADGIYVGGILNGIPQNYVRFDANGDVIINSTAKVQLIATSEVDVSAPTVTVTATTVNLGATGGAAVARVGDTVVGGVITSGSTKVKAA